MLYLTTHQDDKVWIVDETYYSYLPPVVALFHLQLMLLHLHLGHLADAFIQSYLQ